jgi:monoamine oxidase
MDLHPSPPSTKSCGQCSAAASSTSQGYAAAFSAAPTSTTGFNDPWTLGSYAAILPGQYTRFVGFVGKPEGNLHLAGEHTAPLADQGYLDGAVRTGRRAAREILRRAV